MPVIDADGMGRAFPRVPMVFSNWPNHADREVTWFMLNGVDFPNSAFYLSGHPGDVVSCQYVTFQIAMIGGIILRGCADSSEVEAKVGQHVMEFGGVGICFVRPLRVSQLVGLGLNPVSKDSVLHKGPQFTLSHSWRIGQSIFRVY